MSKSKAIKLALYIIAAILSFFDDETLISMGVPPEWFQEASRMRNSPARRSYGIILNLIFLTNVRLAKAEKTAVGAAISDAAVAIKNGSGMGLGGIIASDGKLESENWWQQLSTSAQAAFDGGDDTALPIHNLAEWADAFEPEYRNAFLASAYANGSLSVARNQAAGANSMIARSEDQANATAGQGGLFDRAQKLLFPNQ